LSIKEAHWNPAGLSYFALIAVFIACLGLFGLASFSAEQRTKEISIRKVLGASAARIIILLTKEFILMVGLANLIAWPLAWYGMNKWLGSFSYRINLELSFFILAGGTAFLIATASVSSQFAKATWANPTDDIFTSAITRNSHNITETSQQKESFKIYRPFLPNGRTDLAVSASL
jgi:hypothetical protein